MNTWIVFFVGAIAMTGCAGTSSDDAKQTAEAQEVATPAVASLRADRSTCADIQQFVVDHGVANLYRNDGAFDRVVSGAQYCQWFEGTGTRPITVASQSGEACVAGYVCYDEHADHE